MKNTYKIYLESEDYKKLKEKAEALGFSGKGGVSHYIEKICKSPIVFIDANSIELLRLMAPK